MRHVFVLYCYAGISNKAGPIHLIRNLRNAGRVHTRETIMVTTDDDQAAELIRSHADPKSILISTTQAVEPSC